jgi:hypothetical protein
LGGRGEEPKQRGAKTNDERPPDQAGEKHETHGDSLVELWLVWIDGFEESNIRDDSGAFKQTNLNRK